MSEVKTRFNAPIPGQSLTGKLGTKSWEAPPQYTGIEEALDALWTTMSSPKEGFKITKMLEADIPVEMITNTILTAGFAKGKWNPDMILLMKPTVMKQIAAIGLANGLDDFEIKLPRNDMGDFMDDLEAMKSKRGIKEQVAGIEEPREMLGGAMAVGMEEEEE